MLDILFRKLMDRRKDALSGPVPVAPQPQPAQARESPRLPDTAIVQIEWLDQSDELQRAEAKVHDRSRRGFSLWLPKPLQVGWPVLIAHRETLYRGVVRHHQEVDGRWKTGFQVVADERRRDDRYPFRCKAEISWPVEGKTDRFPCEIYDANGAGVQVEIAEEPPADATICLYYDGWRRFGSTAWSRPRDDRHRVGIHFTGAPISDQSADYKG